MTEENDDEPRRRHEFSSGAGFDDPYEGFDLDPPELRVDPSKVDPVDSHVIADELDERQVRAEDVSADDLLDVGLNYMGINRFEQATESFERAARYADDDTTEQEAWVNKGIAHAELEEWDEAISSQREAIHVLEEGGFAAEAHTNLAYALWEFGETEDAYYHAEEAVRLNDRLPQAWYNLGFIENEQGRHEAAAEALENATKLGFRAADVYEEKARALDELGREEDAQQAIEQAEEIQQAKERELVGE
jgi:tetratricopeptide (TPR) repeat protein